jgi:tight adherence protein C
MLFWLSILLTGSALTLLVYLLALPASGSGQPAARSLPVGLRLVWPWIIVVSVPSQRLASWSQRERMARRLQHAGLAHDLQVPQLAALHYCSAAVGAAVSVVLMSVADVSMPLVVLSGLAGALSGYGLPSLWLGTLAARRQDDMRRELPFMLDITTLCVQAGLNLHGALVQAVQYGPAGALRAELQRALGDMRAGMPRLQALDTMAERTALAEVRSLVLALRQADELGMSLAPLLKSQSLQRQAERFQRAEKRALEAPVKMLLPMIVCIFPCTFLIIGFPVFSRFMNLGIL